MVQSQHGKSTDLENKITEDDDGTYIQSRQKLDEGSKRDTTSDKMARWLGIATAILVKYRSIIKLPDDVVESIARMLDQKKTTLEAIYMISGLQYGNIMQLVDYLDEYPDHRKIDMVKLKAFYTETKSAAGLLRGTEMGEYWCQQTLDTRLVQILETVILWENTKGNGSSVCCLVSAIEVQITIV